jgi:hypothetical protein
MVLQEEHLKPGVKVSCDQYMSALKGCLPNTKRKDLERKCYISGTIFYNHGSGYIFTCNHVSLKSGETVGVKQTLKQIMHKHGHTVKSYCTDNVPAFNFTEYGAKVTRLDQTIDFLALEPIIKIQ